MPVKRFLALIPLVAAAPATAHNPVTGTVAERLAGLLLALALVSFWLLYLRGCRTRPPAAGRAVTFHLTTLLCALTLVGPLDDWAKTGSAAHMSQHMLLIVVIAPLWVISRPLAQLVAGGGWLATRLAEPLLRFSAQPMMTAWVHGAVIWLWHAPWFYELAASDPWWHALAHVCLLATAGVFWWAVLSTSSRNAAWALLALLFTLMHTGFLGALLTFARSPMYTEARGDTDQQLAGLVMWVVAGLPYLLASAWVGHRWYRQMMRRI